MIRKEAQNIKPMTLKPGLLVSLKTTLSGGVEYDREDIAEKKEGSAKIEEWKTIKRVADQKEHEAGSKLRSKLGGLVRRVCAPSAFGYICPLSKERELDEAIAEAKAGAAAFNKKAKTTQIGIYVLKGRIAETDQEATAAIQSEMREMLTEMQRAIEGGAVEDAREAASKLLKMGMVLDEDTQKKVSKAVEEVREVAKAIVKKVSAGGVTTAEAVAGIKFKAVEEARFAFLDEGAEISAATLPATDARSLDDDDDESENETPKTGDVEAPTDLKAAAPSTDVRGLDV